MLEIGDTVVSFDLFEHKFCCDLSVCRGCCCVEGDAGAPLTEEEVKKLDKVLPAVRQFLSARALEVIDSQGTSYIDADGDNVTSLVDGRECLYVFRKRHLSLCLRESLQRGAYRFPKTYFVSSVSGTFGRVRYFHGCKRASLGVLSWCRDLRQRAWHTCLSLSEKLSDTTLWSRMVRRTEQCCRSLLCRV